MQLSPAPVVPLMHAQKRRDTLKTGSFCRCFSMERAVCGLKMTGEPVVSVLSSRSSEIPGASEPGAKQMVKGGEKMFYSNVSGLRI